MQNHSLIPTWMPRLHLIAKRPLPPGYPKELRVLGHHILKKRFDLKLSQAKAASALRVSANTLHNWELSRTSSHKRFTARIHDFLGYCPLFSQDERRPPAIRPERDRCQVPE